jgi:hypothetical protein
MRKDIRLASMRNVNINIQRKRATLPQQDLCSFRVLVHGLFLTVGLLSVQTARAKLALTLVAAFTSLHSPIAVSTDSISISGTTSRICTPPPDSITRGRTHAFIQLRTRDSSVRPQQPQPSAMSDAEDEVMVVDDEEEEDAHSESGGGDDDDDEEAKAPAKGKKGSAAAKGKKAAASSTKGAKKAAPAKRKDAPTGGEGGGATKKAKPITSESTAKDTLRTYMKQQNRPYTALVIYGQHAQKRASQSHG